jgi:hypothetical protein
LPWFLRAAQQKKGLILELYQGLGKNAPAYLCQGKHYYRKRFYDVGSRFLSQWCQDTQHDGTQHDIKVITLSIITISINYTKQNEIQHSDAKS